MPKKSLVKKARRAKKQGKAPTTQASPFVEEEMRQYRKGKKGIKSKKQAVAIGLSKARRAGVKLPRRRKK